MPDEIPLIEMPEDGRAPLPSRPPSDARIAEYRVMPWPDGTRVTVEMTMTPFREFPDFDVLIVDASGAVIKETSMVASMERKPAPTVWLPKLEKGTPLLAVMQILGNGQVLQTVEVNFAVGGPIVKQVIGES
jgi:hypothetical protein